jgi:hypothetical protein
LAGVSKLALPRRHIGLDRRVGGVTAIATVGSIGAAGVGGVARVGPRVLTNLARRTGRVAAAAGNPDDQRQHDSRLKETVLFHMHSPRSRIATLSNQFDIGVAFVAKT